MKLNTSPRVGVADPMLQRELREHAQQVNALSEGRIAAAYGALAAPPTAGTYAQGDVIRNSAPTELGAAGSKYIVMSWTCTVSGTPGTFRENRSPTGN